MRYQATKPEPRLPIFSDEGAVLANVEPLGNRVIVRRCKPETERNGVLIASSEKDHWAIVLAMGPGKKLKNGDLGPMEFKVGDKVLLGHFDDYPKLTAGDQDVIVVREGDILAVADGD